MKRQELRQIVKEELEKNAKLEQKTRKNESSMGSKYDTIVDKYSKMKFIFNKGLAANIGKGYIPGTAYNTVTEKVRVLIYIFDSGGGNIQFEIYENDKRIYWERLDHSKLSFPYHLLKEITNLSKLELMLAGSVVYA
jgi:hypothetical protein